MQLGKRILLTTLASAGLWCALPTATAVAGPMGPGVEWTATGPQFGWDGTMGYQFHVRASGAQVVALGYFTDGGAVPGPTTVGLWTNDGTELAQVDVLPTDPVLGHFQYHAIAPVSLGTGQDYVVGGQAGLYTLAPVGFTVNPDIQFVQDRWNFFGTGFAYPINSAFDGSVPAYFGGNVELSGGAIVPEPATLGLLGLGTLGLVGYGWRRRQLAMAAA
jgi:hypothetical protein